MHFITGLTRRRQTGPGAGVTELLSLAHTLNTRLPEKIFSNILSENIGSSYLQIPGQTYVLNPVARPAALRYRQRMKRHGQELRHRAARGRKSRFLSAPGGFSMIELLVVLALILILTMLFWGGGGSGRQRQQQKSCQKNLQKIFLAMEIYTRDNAGRFPFVAGAKTSEEALDLLVPRYTVDTGSFICPGSQDPAPTSGEPLSRSKISYAYYRGRRVSDTSVALMSDEQADTLAKAAGQPAFSTNGKGPGNNHPKSGGNFLFVDGRVEHTPARPPFSLMLTQGVVLLNPKP